MQEKIDFALALQRPSAVVQALASRQRWPVIYLVKRHCHTNPWEAVP